jgi:hypothetical protein
MTSAGQIRVKREGAERARRLADFITSEEDKARMLAFADELDAQADALEAAGEQPAPVTQEQVQVQQGPPASKDEKK